MTNNDKMQIAADLVKSVVSTSSADIDYRLEAIPEALEKIYKKIGELTKSNSKVQIIDDISEQTIV